MSDPASPEYQRNTNALFVIGIALVLFSTVIGPALVAIMSMIRGE